MTRVSERYPALDTNTSISDNDRWNGRKASIIHAIWCAYAVNVSVGGGALPVQFGALS